MGYHNNKLQKKLDPDDTKPLIEYNKEWDYMDVLQVTFINTLQESELVTKVIVAEPVYYPRK